MKLNGFTRVSALAALVLATGAGVALISNSYAEPPAGEKPAGAPGKGPGGPGGPGGAGGGERGPRSKWAEQYKEELREHPRMARSLIALHETKEHLENAGHDFGGHKVAAIKAIDEAIKELKEAIKFDAKQEEKKGEGEGRRPGRGGPGGERPGPGGGAPAPK
jgi:hypothetical protein